MRKLNQKGAGLVVLVFFIALAITGYLIHIYNPIQLRLEQDKTTTHALATAKHALTAYALEQITAGVRSPPLLRCIDRNSDGMINTSDIPYSPENCNCGLNCERPADLPCPDLDNDGEAETACASNINMRLGRLPWKTLGTEDLRDGAGERLWYAVSNPYKNNPRQLPMNSQTAGAISLRNINGLLQNDASVGNGVVAVVIAAQGALTRIEIGGGTTLQERNAANINNPIHYLDVAQNEDNRDFVENDPNGFISGVAKIMQNNQTVIIANDIVLPIYQNDLSDLSKITVLNEVSRALLQDSDTLPAPSLNTDNTCTGNGNINNSVCNADTSSSEGFIPVGAGDDPDFIGWQTKNVNSILRGDANNNWFQQNGWRNLVRYQKNAPCDANENGCRTIDAQTTIRIN